MSSYVKRDVSAKNIFTGNSRNAWIQRVTPSAAGILGVTYTDVAGTSAVSIVDGAYTVNIQYNSTWAVGTFGTTPSSATHNLAISATNANANSENGRTIEI